MMRRSEVRTGLCAKLKQIMSQDVLKTFFYFKFESADPFSILNGGDTGAFGCIKKAIALITSDLNNLIASLKVLSSEI